MDVMQLARELGTSPRSIRCKLQYDGNEHLMPTDRFYTKKDPPKGTRRMAGRFVMEFDGRNWKQVKIR